MILYRRKEGRTMSVIDLINVLAFGLTCFSIGYMIGSDSNKTQK